MWCALFFAAYGLGVFVGWGTLIAWMSLLVVAADWLQERQELRQEREDFPKAKARDRLLVEGMGHGPPIRLRRPDSHYGERAQW